MMDFFILIGKTGIFPVKRNAKRDDVIAPTPKKNCKKDVRNGENIFLELFCPIFGITAKQSASLTLAV